MIEELPLKNYDSTYLLTIIIGFINTTLVDYLYRRY